MTSLATPLPDPLELIELPHPEVPLELDGIRILHLSDLHVRSFTPARARTVALLNALNAAHPHLIVLTGDLMDRPGQEDATLQTLKLLSQNWQTLPLDQPPLALGIFGNHDTPELRRRAQRELPMIRFLDNQTLTIHLPDQTRPLNAPPRMTPLDIVGLSYPEDPLTALLSRKPDGFALTLAHHPTCLIACASFKLPLVLAGHTHAGQIRLSPTLAPHTSSDLPSHQATGLLRLGTTLMAISRGIGDGVVQGLRINCPPQAPLYVLRRGPLPALPARADPRTVVQVRAW